MQRGPMSPQPSAYRRRKAVRRHRSSAATRSGTSRWRARTPERIRQYAPTSSRSPPDLNHRRITMRRSVLAAAIATAIVLAQPQAASANGGDFKLDFIAAAPFTYDHATGGGAFD